MSGRVTAEIVADLRRRYNVGPTVLADAADRLTELDASNARLVNRCAEYQVAAVRQRIAFTDALPSGVSIERVIAIARGVINDVDEHGTNDWQSIREYLLHADLRSVKP